MKNYIDGLQFGLKVIGYIENDVMDYANKHDIISIHKSDFEYLIRCAEGELSTEENIFNLENKETGHWIRQKGAYGLADTCECSVCGRTIYAGNENDLKDYPYCHCGAKMKGK